MTFPLKVPPEILPGVSSGEALVSLIFVTFPLKIPPEMVPKERTALVGHFATKGTVCDGTAVHHRAGKLAAGDDAIIPHRAGKGAAADESRHSSRSHRMFRR